MTGASGQPWTTPLTLGVSRHHPLREGAAFAATWLLATLGPAAFSPVSAQSLGWSSTPVNLCPQGDGSRLVVSGVAPGDTVEVDFDLSSCPQACVANGDGSGVAHYLVYATGPTVEIAPIVGGVGCCTVTTSVSVNSTPLTPDVRLWRSFDLSKADDPLQIAGDCLVDDPDTTYFSSVFLTTACEADYSGDGTVGLADYGLFAPHFSHRAPTTTRRVPLDYPDIQSALNASVPGDTVLVADGTYSGAGNCGLDFGGTDIVLVSESGAAFTTVDCQETDRILYFHSGETAAAVVGGFTLTGGDSTIGGSAIRVGLPGGAGASSPTIRDCVVEDNVAAVADSGVVLLQAGSPQFTNVLVVSNRSPGGGNVVVTGGAPAFTGGSVSWNVGTGIVAYPASATFTGCGISGNTRSGVHLPGSVSAPGIARSDSCLEQPVFTGCLITGNTTTASGGGILIDPVVFCVYSPLFEACLVAGNSASGYGGGVALLGTVWDGATAPAFHGCTIAGNSAGSSGGAFYVGAYDAAGLGLGMVIADGALLWDNCSDTAGNGVLVEADNELALSCGIADTSAAGIQGPGTITLTDVVCLAPGFCGSVLCGEAPTTLGNFHVAADSPALPGNPGNPCGARVGAFDTACAGATDAKEAMLPPGRFELHPTRPNPFDGTTTISYDVPSLSRVDVRIFDVAGRLVRAVRTGAPHAPGRYRLTWDARDQAGHRVPAGIYFCRIEAGEFCKSRKMVLLR